MLILHHPECERHEMGPHHPERPERLQAIEAALKQCAYKDQLVWQKAKQIDKTLLLLAHPKSYVDAIFAQSPKSDYASLDPDTVMNPHTLNAALYAAGSLVQAVDAVLKGQYSKVYCHVRPPGHHAEKNKAMGFCFFSNVALGALYALEKMGLSRVAIVDIDVHHGNGTQDIIFDDDRVLFCSSFEHPFYPATHLQTNDHVIHSRLAAGTAGRQWRQALTPWFDKIQAFKPELIFVSAGFDAHKDDFLADIRLVEDDYAWFGQNLKKVADEVCDGKIIATLEGGYELSAIAKSCEAFLEAIAFFLAF